MKAIFRTTLETSGQASGDVVTGCQLAALGKLGTFENLEGKPTSILVTEKLIGSLLAILQKKGRLSAHLSHDWIYNDEEPIKSAVATWRNFRLDGAGNLIADAELWPTESKPAIMHAATNDPEGLMVSLVFDYTGGQDTAIATGVNAADFVETGAITTALCAAIQKATCDDSTETNPNKSMDIQELISALADPTTGPALAAAIQGALKHIKANTPDPDVAAEDTEATAAETEAGVMAEDKKPEDDKKPAFMRAACRINRATARLSKETTAKLDTVKEEAAVLAEARFTQKMGQGGFKVQTEKQEGEDSEAVLAKYITAGAKNRAVAIMRLSQDDPKKYNELRAAGKI